MNLVEAIKQRRTVHHYRHEDIPLEIIEEALELALYAPNHRLTYPWGFRIVGRQTRQKLLELALELKPGSDSAARLKMQNKLINPAYLIVVTNRKSPLDPFREREDYATCACSIQNICLYLWEKGVATKWGTGELTKHPKSYQWLEVNPDKSEIIGFLWVGLAESIPEVRTRPELKTFLKYLD